MKWKYLIVFLIAITDRLRARQALIAGLCFMMAPLSPKAQVDSLRTEDIAVKARPSADSILLRWAPLTYGVWRSANRNGYRIERFLIAKNGKIMPVTSQTILQEVITPWPEAEWEALVGTSQYGAIAAQALFGERFDVALTDGDILSVVNKVKENEQRFAFALFSADMSPRVALASGLWFADKTVKAGEKYLYRVVVNGSHEHYGSSYVGTDDKYLLPEPRNFKGEFEDHIVTLRWDRPTASPYSAFVLERSLDGKKFSRVSDIPIITLSPEHDENQRYEYAADSLQDNVAVHYYRVKGITPFGEEGPASTIVSGKGSSAIERVPYITSAESNDNRTMLLKWDFPEESNSGIRGFSVERSSAPDKSCVPLTPHPISPLQREYIDTSPDIVNYYRVQALGLDGKEYTSHAYFAQLIDSIPPLTPTGIQAVVSGAGKVLLSWTPNPDDDIYGYRVYRSWLRSAECSQITSAPIIDTHFTDSIDLYTLNDSVYYRVMAVDINQNHSAPSVILGVSLPDSVKPQAPLILPARTDATNMTLSWIAGGSEDIVAYDVYRRQSSETGWLKVGTIASSRDSIYTYVDSNVPSGQVYYTVISIDDAGLESDPAHPVARMSMHQHLPPAVNWNKPKMIADENKVKLSWTYETKVINAFKVFRSVNHAPTTLLTTVNASHKELTDTIIPGNVYAYRILACFPDGRKSALSDELKFKF